MSKSYEDNKGNFWETFSDGTVSRNGTPVGTFNKDGEYLPYSGNGMYVINDHKIINNGKTVGSYDIHVNITFYDNAGGSSAGELNRSSPGLRSETKLVILLIAGILGGLINFIAAAGFCIVAVAVGIKETGSLGGCIKLLYQMAEQKLYYEFDGFPYADILVRYFLIAAAVTVLAMLVVCITVTIIVAVKLRKRKKQKKYGKETF